MLTPIKAAEMMLSKSKCRFGVENVESLEYEISKGGIIAGTRAQGIRNCPSTSVTAVSSLLGLANQYARFSDKLAC